MTHYVQHCSDLIISRKVRNYVYGCKRISKRFDPAIERNFSRQACNGVTNCYNAFACLLIVVSLSNLPNLPNGISTYQPTLRTLQKPSLTLQPGQSSLQFPEEFGNLEMSFDNYRIRPHFTQNYFVWAMVGASRGRDIWRHPKR